MAKHDQSSPVEDLGSNIAVFAGLIPGLADDGAGGGAQETGIVRVSGRNSGGGGRRSHGSDNAAELEKKGKSFP